MVKEDIAKELDALEFDQGYTDQARCFLLKHKLVQAELTISGQLRISYGKYGTAHRMKTLNYCETCESIIKIDGSHIKLDDLVINLIEGIKV